MKREDQNRSGEYEKSYGGSSYNKDERSHYTIRKEETAPPKARRVENVPPKARKEETIPPRDAGSISEETPDQQTAQKMKRAKTIYKKLFMAWLFLFLLSNVFTCIMERRPWMIRGAGTTRTWKRILMRFRIRLSLNLL